MEETTAKLERACKALEYIQSEARTQPCLQDRTRREHSAGECSCIKDLCQWGTGESDKDPRWLN